MAWRKQPSHRLVAFKDVRRLTGIDPKKLLLERDTQHLVRIDDGGARVEFFRVPLDMLETKPEE
jgi:hypothetical protein